MIRYLEHNEINRQQWDDCIKHSVSGMPYALSWWLDAVCPGWAALVEDDYNAVMPLTQGYKYGVYYLYQPYFTQQLGVFSIPEAREGQMSEFMSAIPSKYQYFQIQLNSGNILKDPDFNLSFRKNYLLDLTPSALELAGNYHRNCRRNIQKAIHAGLTVKHGPGPALFSRFIRRNLDRKLTETRSTFYPVLEKITQASIQNGVGEIAGVYNITGKLVAAGWFVTTLGRCLFVVCASSPEGMKNEAMFLLVDHMIGKNAHSGLIFDFAGSNLPGIAYFNAGFGATETYYPEILKNNLPWPLRLLKR